MNILLLGGNSPRHHGWVRELQAHLQDGGDEVTLHDYRHWETGDENADVPYEIDAVSNLANAQEHYMVIAKSVGTVIATRAIAQGKIHPSACVFLGVPHSSLGKHLPDIRQDLGVLPPTVFAQNSGDPLGSADLVKEYVAQNHPATWEFVATPGETHDYSDFQLIADLAARASALEQIK